MKATKQQLIEAKALIQDKKNWTRGAYARDSQGFQVRPRSSFATCFCSVGALLHVAGAEDEASTALAEPLRMAALRLGWGTAEALNDNDTLGHDKVMLMFKKVIEEAPE